MRRHARRGPPGRLGLRAHRGVHREQRRPLLQLGGPLALGHGRPQFEEPAAQPAAAAPAPEPEPTFEQPAVVAEAVAIDVNADTIDYEAKWAPMEVVVALFIFVTCAFSMTRLCRAKEDQYAPVTRAISEEDLVAPDVETGPTLEDKRRMLD